MRRSGAIFLIAVVFALAAPVYAEWVDKTADWTAQGLVAGGQLNANTDTNTLYYIANERIWRYAAGSDTWTEMTSASSNHGYLAGGWFTTTTYVDGKFILKQAYNGTGAPNYWLDIYDTATDTWSSTNVEVGAYAYRSTYEGDGLGNVYSPVDGLLHVFWTDTSGQVAGNTYDPVTGEWGTAVGYTGVGPSQLWGSMPSVNVGFVSYSVRTERNYGSNPADKVYLDQTVKMDVYDLFNGFPTDQGTYDYTTTSEFDLGTNHFMGESYYAPLDLWCEYVCSACAVQLMAVSGTDIYMVGTFYGSTGIPEGTVLEAVIYHTDTGTWENLGGPPVGNAYRDHSVTIAGNMLYVQDGATFWTYAIPEPATVLLLGLGGALSLLRRRR